jgi:hypothetical protein
LFQIQSKSESSHSSGLQINASSLSFIQSLSSSISALSQIQSLSQSLHSFLSKGKTSSLSFFISLSSLLSALFQIQSLSVSNHSFESSGKKSFGSKYQSQSVSFFKGFVHVFDSLESVHQSLSSSSSLLFQIQSKSVS